MRGLVSSLSSRPSRPLFDEAGTPVPAAGLDALEANVGLDAIPATQAARYALVTRRAALRTFPTDLRVFSRAGETDIAKVISAASLLFWTGVVTGGRFIAFAGTGTL